MNKEMERMYMYFYNLYNRSSEPEMINFAPGRLIFGLTHKNPSQSLGAGYTTVKKMDKVPAFWKLILKTFNLLNKTNRHVLGQWVVSLVEKNKQGRKDDQSQQPGAAVGLSREGLVAKVALEHRPGG